MRQGPPTQNYMENKGWQHTKLGVGLSFVALEFCRALYHDYVYTQILLCADVLREESQYTTCAILIPCNCDTIRLSLHFVHSILSPVLWCFVILKKENTCKILKKYMLIHVVLIIMLWWIDISICDTQNKFIYDLLRYIAVSLSVHIPKKKNYMDRGVGGWGPVHPIFFWIFGIF